MRENGVVWNAVNGYANELILNKDEKRNKLQTRRCGLMYKQLTITCICSVKSN